MKNQGIGKLIDGPQTRDAVHVPVSLVTAATKVYPGQKVDKDGDPDGEPIVGIVDPFLDGPVFPGTEFWIALLPGTITSLAHSWEHPAFDREPAKTQGVGYITQARAVQLSREWLENHAVLFNMTYDQLVEAARKYLETGDYVILGFDTPDAAYTDRDKMWKHLEIAAGIKAPDDPESRNFFSCAC